jgi:hypothetical protein
MNVPATSVSIIIIQLSIFTLRSETQYRSGNFPAKSKPTFAIRTVWTVNLCNLHALKNAVHAGLAQKNQEMVTGYLSWLIHQAS